MATSRFRTLTYALLLGLLTAALFGCASNNGLAGGSGMIEADEVLVAAETSGRVLARYVDEGDVVAVGDTLATLDASHVDLQLESLHAARKVALSNLRTARIQAEQAEATEKFAQKEFARASELLQSGTASQRQYDQAQHEHATAVNAHNTARSQVRTVQAEIERIDTEIASLQRVRKDFAVLSPTRGTVTEKFVEPGELLAPGKPVIRIADLSSVWVKIYLNATAFAEVNLGDTASVDIETGAEPMSGVVIWTADKAEFTPKNVQTEESRADLVYAVKVRIANDDARLKIGMPVFVTLED